MLGPPLTRFGCQGLASPRWPTQKDYKPLPCSWKPVREVLVTIKSPPNENTFFFNDVVVLLAQAFVVAYEAQEEVFTFFWKDEIVIRALIPSQRPQAGYVHPDSDAVSRDFSNKVISTYTTSSISKNNPPIKGSSREDIGGWLQ